MGDYSLQYYEKLKLGLSQERNTKLNCADRSIGFNFQPRVEKKTSMEGDDMGAMV
jgi:hypothetical protein